MARGRRSARSSTDDRPGARGLLTCYTAATVRLPPALHPLFWDCPPDAIDPDAHATLVLERALEYGSLEGVRWTLAYYGADRLRDFLRRRGVRTLSRKTLGFWTMLLQSEGEACFETSSLRRSRPSWDY